MMGGSSQQVQWRGHTGLFHVSLRCLSFTFSFLFSFVLNSLYVLSPCPSFLLLLPLSPLSCQPFTVFLPFIFLSSHFLPLSYYFRSLLILSPSLIPSILASLSVPHTHVGWPTLPRSMEYPVQFLECGSGWNRSWTHSSLAFHFGLSCRVARIVGVRITGPKLFLWPNYQGTQWTVACFLRSNKKFVCSTAYTSTKLQQ